MRCIRCGSMQRRRDGHTRLGGQRWRCTACRRRFTARSSSAFSCHGFADEIVTLAVRWYVRYRLSYADVSELLAGRGVMVSRSTLYRWVQRFLLLFAEAARRQLLRVEHRCSRYLNNALERDHGHLKQRLRPMRGFKQLASADAFSRGHALMQNLRNGFSTLTITVPRRLRLLEAWPQLGQAI
jgi:transposase-like protein